jgi:hypothetical protein
VNVIVIPKNPVKNGANNLVSFVENYPGFHYWPSAAQESKQIISAREGNPMSVERIFDGQSTEGDLQEALNNALQRLSEDLGKDGVRDASASWIVTEIAGNRGGFAGFHSVKVSITAKRTPEWGLS